MESLQELREALRLFVEEREWSKYHTPKDLAISLALEAAEVLEHFQWKDEAQVAAYLSEHRDKLAAEMADVLNYLVMLADKTGIDLLAAAHAKVASNAAKYPVEKIKGNYRKYTEL